MKKVYIFDEDEMKDLEKLLQDIQHSIHVIEQSKYNPSVIDREIENIGDKSINGIYLIANRT